MGADSAVDKPIVAGMMFEPVSFNPLRGIDSGSYYASTLVYEGLVKYDQDLVLVPGLAESFTVDADGLVYDFVLRPDLRYSTGEAVTAGDVKAAVELAVSMASPFRSDYTDIDSVKIIDRRHVRIILKQRCQPFLSRLAELRILPEALSKSADHGNRLLARQPVATGPYRLKRWETGLELVFERNPYYWGAPAKTGTIVWRIIPDRTVAAVALAKGEIDLAQTDGRMWQNYLARPNSTRTNDDGKGLAVDQFNGNRTVYLGFNLRRPPFDQKTVRRAFTRAINRDALCRVFYAGSAIVPDTDTPQAHWTHTQTESQSFDPTGTAGLLAAAGYKRDQSGQKAWLKDGKPLALRILTVKDLEDVADVVSDDLVRVGIKSEVEVIEYSTLRRLFLQKGNFDAVLWSRSCGPDPESTIVWSSKGPLNFCGLKSDYVDGLLRAGRLAPDMVERKRCYGDLQKYLAGELPWAFLAQPKLLVAHKASIVGVQRGKQATLGLPWDNPTFNAAFWQRVR